MKRNRYKSGNSLIFICSGYCALVFTALCFVLIWGCSDKPSKQQKQSEMLHSVPKPENRDVQGKPELSKREMKTVQQRSLMTDTISVNEVFKTHCAACHGDDKNGLTGPSLLRIGSTYDEGAIKTIILTGKGKMPQIAIAEKEASQLARWLAQQK